jgi:hypothetical protein
MIDRVPAGLSYQEYMQCLFRIAVKRNAIFNEVFKRYVGSANAAGKSPDRSNSRDMREFVKQQRKLAGEDELPTDENDEKEIKEKVNYEENAVERDKVDDYSNISGTTASTVEGLMTYLYLPEDKIALMDRVKQLRKENSRIIAPKQRKESKLRTWNRLMSVVVVRLPRKDKGRESSSGSRSAPKVKEEKIKIARVQNDGKKVVQDVRVTRSPEPPTSLKGREAPKVNEPRGRSTGKGDLDAGTSKNGGKDVAKSPNKSPNPKIPSKR